GGMGGPTGEGGGPVRKRRAPKNRNSPPRNATSSNMMRDVFAFTVFVTFPSAKARRKTGANGFEKHRRAIMHPEHARPGERQGHEHAADEQRPGKTWSCDKLRHGDDSGPV